MKHPLSATFWRERVPTWLLATALAVALAGSFVGLRVSGFWLDELFTAWVVGADHSLSAAWARTLTDVHPPIYYMSLFAFSDIFGASEVSLRAFSAVCAVAAVLVFLFATDVFSLRARLFASVLATASSYWFIHSQDARSYALGLLASAWILASAARLLKAPRARGALASLALATLAGCFVHYYLFLISEAVLAVLFLRRPGLRAPLAVWGVVLLALLYAYLTLVERPHALVLMEHGWIGSSPTWYLRELTMAAKQIVNRWTIVAVLLSLLGFGIAVIRGRESPGEIMLLAAAVPILVLAGGVAASAISAPNFTDRNFLLCSPFLWTLIAGFYDQGVDGPSRLAPWVTALVAATATFSVGHVLWRFVPRNTPFRESGAWIAQQSDCAGRPIPVLINRATPMTPAFTELRARADYGYYLPGQPLEPVFKEQLTTGALLPESGCSVLAWAGHYVTDNADAQRLARSLSAGGRTIEVRAFTVPNDPNGVHSAFVFIRKGASAANDGLTR